MINRLTGVLVDTNPQSVTIDVGGVGFLVFVNLSTLSRLGHIGEQVSVVTYMEVKEDKLALYGFITTSEYELFQLLIGVNGVGCKSALSILDLGSPEQIQNAIGGGEVKVITQVSGIGKKTAERIILELKEKVSMVTGGQEIFIRVQHEELIEALESLGYKSHDIQRVLSAVDTNLDLGEQVRQALKHLQIK